ncbi:MAG: DMT family transporter [Ruminococcaceae bacterium]|nr:DMT family transporter [Oscillospiraceae bacterium]
MTKKSLLGNFLLLLTAIIWGSAFVAQRSGLDTMGPVTFNGIRSFIGAAALLAFLLIRAAATRSKLRFTKKELIFGSVCGAILFFASTTQQMGLATVSAGRAGFLTTLYIVLVPIIRALGGKKLRPCVICAVALAMFGLALLSVAEADMPDGKFSLAALFSGFSFGDVLVIISAFCYSFHIIAVDRFAVNTDAPTLSCVQFAVCGLISLPVFAIFETVPDAAALAGGWVELLYAGVMSSGVAYTLQIAGQKLSPNPTVASVLMSTESVFAVIFGVLILRESHTLIEYLGCALVFAAVILVQMPSKKKTNA